MPGVFALAVWDQVLDFGSDSNNTLQNGLTAVLLVVIGHMIRKYYTQRLIMKFNEKQYLNRVEELRFKEVGPSCERGWRGCSVDFLVVLDHLVPISLMCFDGHLVPISLMCCDGHLLCSLCWMRYPPLDQGIQVTLRPLLVSEVEPLSWIR